MEKNTVCEIVDFILFRLGYTVLKAYTRMNCLGNAKFEFYIHKTMGDGLILKTTKTIAFYF